MTIRSACNELGIDGPDDKKRPRCFRLVGELAALTAPRQQLGIPGHLSALTEKELGRLQCAYYTNVSIDDAGVLS